MNNHRLFKTPSCEPVTARQIAQVQPLSYSSLSELFCSKSWFFLNVFLKVPKKQNCSKLQFFSKRHFWPISLFSCSITFQQIATSFVFFVFRPFLLLFDLFSSIAWRLWSRPGLQNNTSNISSFPLHFVAVAVVVVLIMVVVVVAVVSIMVAFVIVVVVIIVVVIAVAVVVGLVISFSMRKFDSSILAEVCESKETWQILNGRQYFQNFAWSFFYLF